MEINQTTTAESRCGKHVVVVGLGNIGSPLVEMLSRTDAVGRLTLVDKDVYEKQNLRGQAIVPGDVGNSKAFVQAERARQIRPELRVEAIHAAVEDVPLGRLRGDVVLTCLDSKSGRQQVNQRVWRLGVSWVDAGVSAEGLLARVNVYLPGPDQPCLECAWDERDYQTLEVRRRCQAGGGESPTHAPAFLGSLAAALQSVECANIISGDWESVAAGKQITIAAASHKLYETTFRRNPKCRFDHSSCQIHAFTGDPQVLSLGELMARVKHEFSPDEGVRLHIEGKPFQRRLRCACGEEKPVFCLEGRLAATDRTCARCGGTMEPVGFAMLPFLCEQTLLPEDREKPLAVVGLEAGDVIMARGREGLRGFELIAA